MKSIIPLVVFGCLLVAGCKDHSATNNTTEKPKAQAVVTKKPDMRPETNDYLINSNKIVCIGGAQYFASWGDGGVDIKSPVIDPRSRNNAMACEGGIPLDRFGKLY